MIEQITGSWLCWAIILLALFCYQLLWLDFLCLTQKCVQFGDEVIIQSKVRRDFSSVLIGALPLLGLLGTIMGLLDCFAGIAAEGASSELISAGIGEALLTTQLGLVCAISAWLLHAYVGAAWQRKHTVINSLVGQ